MDQKHDEHKHHILSNKTSLMILICLLVFTLITVWASRNDFGPMNFPIAIFIASVKALLVVLFFMGLKYDENENRVIFFSSIFFVAVFFVLTAADVFTRNANWRAKGPLLKEVAAVSSIRKAWVGTDELRARGKEIFMAQCTVCHGATGQGDGAAAAALNPKPRNFHQDTGWKNGRKVSDVFLTLKNGLNAMPSFATLPSDDRWALAHYVLSLGPKAPEATADDLKKAGISDPTKDDGGAGGADAPQRKIPVEFAIERYLQQAR
jgi:caa(3)-type oxidase subunit IV